MCLIHYQAKWGEVLVDNLLNTTVGIGNYVQVVVADGTSKD
jgi:hypothetical protein